jgi:hypothetical protein
VKIQRKFSVGIILLVLVALIFMPSAFAAKDAIISAGDPAKLGCVYYFYGTDCPGCEQTNLFMESIQNRYPSITLETFEVYYNHDNLNLLNSLFTSYQVPQSAQGIPAVFLAQTYFVGEQSIVSFLDEQLRNTPKLDCPTPDLEEVIGIIGSSDTTDVIKTVGVLKLTASAFRNSLSACGLALILVFILLLMLFLEPDNNKEFNLSERREELLRKTLIFLGGIFAVVLLLAFGLLPLIALSSVTGIVTIIVSILGIIIGIIFLKHFLVAGHVIPRNYLKHVIPPYHKFMKYCKHSAGFLTMGILSSLLLTACWGWKYKVVLTLLSDPLIRWRAFPLFLWHSIVVLIPLGIIAFIIYWRLEKLESLKHAELQLHHFKMLRFVLACVLIILGVLALILMWLG